MTAVVCALTLIASAWSGARHALAQPARDDASTPRDAASDVSDDHGMRCVAITAEETDDEETPSASRDGGTPLDATDATTACALPRAVIDREGHCCLPGQSWRAGACAGLASSCAPGETRGEGDVCAARPRVDAGASARLFEAPTARVAASMAVVPSAVMRFGGAWVSVGPFAIDRTEVTAAAYARCVSAGVCLAAPDPYGQTGARADAPAVNVSWEMARRYCGWSGLRLPTEAEWELAARGLDGRRYPWGERAPDCTLARHVGCGDAPLSVASLPAGRSPFGLSDVAGNVGEWVSDVFGPRSLRDDGRVTMDPTGPASGSQRVVRGGSFASTATEITTDSRRGVDAREQRAEVGFRCARGL
jgi:formylglycine-generating enzyme